MSDSPKFSLVIPIYNEEEVLPELLRRLRPVLTDLNNTSYEMIFVDDGSTDRSAEIILDSLESFPQLRLIKLSRNFGLQPAVTAGLAHARGEIIGLMDGDLQDPPELLPQMLAKIEEGHDVVYMIKRRRKDTFLRRAGFSLFYKLFHLLCRSTPLPPTAGLFSLMRRRVVQSILDCPERNKFIPGLRTWVGYDQERLEFDRSARRAGQPKQTMARLVRLALNAIFSFTDLPLKLAMFVGLFAALAGFLAALIVSILRIFTTMAIPGWASTLVAIFFMGGVQLVCTGLLGEYLSRVYDEVRRRPQFLVDKIFDEKSPPPENFRASKLPLSSPPPLPPRLG